MNGCPGCPAVTCPSLRPRTPSPLHTPRHARRRKLSGVSRPKVNGATDAIGFPLPQGHPSLNRAETEAKKAAREAGLSQLELAQKQRVEEMDEEEEEELALGSPLPSSGPTVYQQAMISLSRASQASSVSRVGTFGCHTLLRWTRSAPLIVCATLHPACMFMYPHNMKVCIKHSHMSTHTHTHIHAHMHMQPVTYTRTHTRGDAYAHAHAHTTRTRTRTRMHSHAQPCTHTRSHTHSNIHTHI